MVQVFGRLSRPELADPWEVVCLKRKFRLEYLSPTAMGLVGILITIIVIRYPDHAFEASLEGLRLWFEIVLPALLPFFVLSEILLGLGVIRAIGVLLEPLMRPVFRIPGEAAFTLAMGLASGYPLGAKLTGRMRRNGMCTREESERLISFANTADPLFMIGAVAFGMFGSAALGITIAVAHYLAVLVVGFMLRYHAGGKMGSETALGSGSYLRRAITAMASERKRDGRPIGALFSDAVRDSMSSMIFIGGTIMMFSVFIRILGESGAGGMLASAAGAGLSALGIDIAMAPAVINGIMEITLGAQTAAAANANLMDRLIVAGFVIGWSGLSVHAQVAAMVHGTDIRLSPYLVARICHGVLAALLTWILFPTLANVTASIPAAMSLPTFPYWVRIAVIGAGAGSLLFGLLAISMVVIAIRRVRVTGFRV